ncbi:MAG: VTT domain-containing protein [Coriobacteriia bacterium]
MVAGEEKRSRWWLGPLCAVTPLVVLAAAYLLVPGVNVLVRTAGSVVKSEETSAIRIFLATWGHRSPIAGFALVVWQALLFPLGDVPVLRTNGLMWGPVSGALINWSGLVAGASLAFAVSRGLVGMALSRRYPLRREPLGIARWVLLGFRLVPFVPQDLVSLLAGGTRTRFREFLLPTAAAALLPATVHAVWPDGGAPIEIHVWAATVAGVVLLVALAWRYRSHIPTGELSVERKRNMVAGSVVVVAACLTYRFVPSVKAGVDEAVRHMAAGDISAVRDYLLTFGVWAPIVSALLMVLQSVLAPLPAFVITFANGMLFGWAWGALLSWSSAMAGAALCFYLARVLGRPAVERLVGGSTALKVSDSFFERFGERAVLIARLLPFVSFDIISYGAGLTSMRFWPFFVATGVGQLPATLVYSYLGQNMSSSVRILFFTFVITIALFVTIAAARPVFMRWMERDREAGEEEEAGADGVA